MHGVGMRMDASNVFFECCCPSLSLKLGLFVSGYLQTVHKAENQVILVHCPEVLDGDCNSKLCSRPRPCFECIVVFEELVHLTNAQWEEALKKDQAKVHELEEKFNAKILENGVGVLLELHIQ
jgi:hypothetical protein